MIAAASTSPTYREEESDEGFGSPRMKEEATTPEVAETSSSSSSSSLGKKSKEDVEKPNLSYNALILMAIRSSPDGKLVFPLF